MRAFSLVIVLWLSTVVVLSSCTSVPKPMSPSGLVAQTPAPFPHQLRIMEYNVENLFDTIRDQDKKDWEYTPKNTAGKNEFCDSEPPAFQKKCRESDWTEAKLEIKLGQIARVVTKVTPTPDILALVEIENESVTRRLADKLGYKGLAITDSPDIRGIDVALLYNESSGLRFVRSQSVRVDLEPVGGKPSRDILIAEFEYGISNRRPLAVFVNHWPSQHNKTVQRQPFAKEVGKLATQYSARGYDVVVTGDFNVAPMNDHPSPFLEFESAKGTVLFDVDQLVRENIRSLNIDPSNLSPGTYFYWTEGSSSRPPAMAWDMLDRFFISPTLLSRVDLKSYRILNDPEFTTTITFKRGPLGGTKVSGVPWRYSHDTSSAGKSGFSDHFAIVMAIGYN